MKRERPTEIHFYEWSIPRWLGSETRMLLDSSGRGIYRDLLDYCYKDGSIPSDLGLLALKASVSKEEMERVWPSISKHFFSSRKQTSRLENHAANLFRKQF